MIPKVAKFEFECKFTERVKGFFLTFATLVLKRVSCLKITSIMKKILALVLISLSCSDKKVEKRNNCVQVEQVMAPTACYDKAQGLTLTADTPSSQGLEWVIAPLADTTGAQTYVPYYVSTASNTITLPDSVIKNFPKIGIAHVGAYGCGSDLYFSFVKRTGPDSCVRWYLQEKFVKGK
jgi:hypothetical protein